MSVYSILVNESGLLDAGYNYFFVDCSSGNIDLYMPENLYDNILFTIKRIDSSINTCILHKNITDEIDINGSNSITLNVNDRIQVISFNTKWWIINTQ